MEPYAIVETGGKQYFVKQNDTLRVEKLVAEEGASIALTPVLAVSDGKTLKVGTPEISDCAISAKVVEHIRGDKVISFKKKRRKGYKRKIGHRQELTVIKVENIGSKKA